MIEIEPIARMSGKPSAREENAPQAEAPASRALVSSQAQTSQAKAATNEAAYTHARPVAAFLTQFIDQHGNFPRDTMRRIGRLDKATSAYHQADNLAERQRYARAPRQGDIEL